MSLDSDFWILLLWAYVPLALTVPTAILCGRTMDRSPVHAVAGLVVELLLAASALFFWAMAQGGYPTDLPHLALGFCLVITLVLNLLDGDLKLRVKARPQ